VDETMCIVQSTPSQVPSFRDCALSVWLAVVRNNCLEGPCANDGLFHIEARESN